MNIPTSESKSVERFVFSDQLDQSFLDKNYSKNLDLAQAIFNSFNETIETEMSELSQAIENFDFNSMVAKAHKIKNNFIYIGASQLNILLSDLEKEAKEECRIVLEIFSEFNTLLEQLLPTIKLEQTRIENFLSKL